MHETELFLDLKLNLSKLENPLKNIRLSFPTPTLSISNIIETETMVKVN